MRHAAAFFLIITLLWQSFALAGQGLMLDYAGDRAHAVLHWDQAGHHHHDDGSLHVDHSDEGNRHVHGDVGGVTVAVLPAPLAVCLPNLRAAAPALGADVVLAPPFLEGPRRPPRLTA